jgi:hypothetical protein
MPAEDKWIHALISEWPPMGKGIGPGDDAAVIPPPARGKHPVLKTDAVVEGVHFLPPDPGGVAHLPQGLGLDLADAFAGDLELAADFLEGAAVAVLEAEALLEHPRSRSVRVSSTS